MGLIVSALFIALIILIGALSKRKREKNQVAAAYLLLGSASIAAAIFFSNMYSLILYGITTVSYVLAVIFALKMIKDDGKEY